jgi:NAD(P)-dependent dehydrogenase (short-subunit alcohol dehydrogenase family)
VTAANDVFAGARLDGRGCVVLGAGAGIGAATCRALTGAGARVLCVDREAALADAIAAEVGGVAHTADVTRSAEVDGVFAAAAELGVPLHGVVDIVGVALTKPLRDTDEEAWDRQFDVVLRHAYLALRIGGAALADAGGGSMVFVGSLSGNASIANQPAYGAAKAALHHLVRASAHELGPKNIRVNALAPGIVRTPRLVARLSDATWRRFEAAIPFGRTATPEDVAAAILFLVSDMSSVISGAVIPIDGALGTVATVPDFTM